MWKLFNIIKFHLHHKEPKEWDKATTRGSDREQVNWNLTWFDVNTLLYVVWWFPSYADVTAVAE